MLNKAQVLIEIVLSLTFLVIILGIIATFLNSIYQTSKYIGINQAVAISGFEKYRNALISLSRTNWNLLNSLSSTTDYYLSISGTDWIVLEGKEKIVSGNESYYFSFRIDNFTTPTIKFITTTAEFSNMILKDYFLLPKINVSF